MMNRREAICAVVVVLVPSIEPPRHCFVYSEDLRVLYLGNLEQAGRKHFEIWNEPDLGPPVAFLTGDFEFLKDMT